MQNNLQKSLQTIRLVLNKKQKSKFVFAGLLSIFHSVIDLLALILLFMTLSSVIAGSENQSFHLIQKIDELLKLQDENLLHVYLFAGIFILFLIKNISSYFSKRYQVRFTFEVSSSISDQLYNQKINSTLDQNKKETTADLGHRINTIAIYFSDYVMLPTLMMLAEFFLAAIVLTSVAIYSIKLFVFLLIFMLPAAYFIASYSKKKLKKNGDIFNKYTPKLLENTQKLIHGFIELKLAEKDQDLEKEFREIRTKIHKSREEIYLHHSVIHTHFMETIVVAGVLALAIIAYNNPSQGSLASSLVLFGTMAFRLIPSINRIITNNNSLRTFSFVLDMMDFKRKDIIHAEKYQPLGFEKSIELKDVSFGFEKSRPVINKLNLSIPKHKKIGILGDSGTGKTTLINLLMGFYKAQEGSISIDEKVLNHELLGSWRKHIGYVRQDSFVSSGTILENVAFGYSKDEIDTSKVERCLDAAKLSSWVHSLDQGLETEIGELGTLISGGQKQRIAIARMLYKEADLFILDEITNSLDATTAAEILNTVYHLNNSKATLVMISHKPEEFHGCDKVYKMVSGRLIEYNG